MSTWTFAVPDWLPCTVNQLLRAVGSRSRLKRGDREVVWMYSRLVPEATGKRRVTVTFVYGKGKRMSDVDSRQKSLLDALKQNRLIVNDSPKWCELGPWLSVRGPMTGVWIELEEVP